MQYEAICAFHPSTAEEKIDSILNRFQQRIQSTGGKVEKVDKQGLKELPYQFQSNKDIKRAYYVQLAFEGEGRTPNELRNIINVTEEIIRHIVTRVN